MAIDKPTKPENEFLPNGFGTGSGVVKNDFSDNKKINGFSANLEDILQGDNLNYTLDTIGKQLKYLTTVVDYINNISVLKVPFINSNNKLDFTDINGLLPSQSGNNGKYLSTNGTTCNWSNDFIKIGDPQFTLNFNQTLPNNCVWLEGAVKPITGDFAQLFAIYGWQYDTTYTNTNQFKLPNFLNRSIWGGTTAGYIQAGLPNIKGSVYHLIMQNEATFNWQGAFYNANIGDNSYKPSSITKVATNKDNIGFDANKGSVASGIYRDDVNTVQPPAIKVRVYTRYK